VASSIFYLIIFIPLSVSGKLTGTFSGFIARVKPASFGLLCAWREVLILRQHKDAIGVDFKLSHGADFRMRLYKSTLDCRV
jgi:hypothetical protein